VRQFPKPLEIHWNYCFTSVEILSLTNGHTLREIKNPSAARVQESSNSHRLETVFAQLKMIPGLGVGG
jgi:hypothetical protein